MSTRLPRAATTLVNQVTERKKRTTHRRESDPDGLGVVRTISFSKQTSKWLAPIMELLADVDGRVHSVNMVDGRLHVRFVADTRADDSTKFSIEEMERILAQE